MTAKLIVGDQVMLREIENLREIANLCRQGGALDPALASWLGSRLEDFLLHRVSHLEEAFGIRNPRGGVNWRMERALRTRDAALRTLAENMVPCVSVRGRAQAIYQLSIRYATSAWRVDQILQQMPKSYAGTPKEHLWIAFRSGAPMPIGLRRLSDIIAT